MALVRNSIKLSSGGGTEITVVANYSALPDPTTVLGEFYWAEASQGTSWLPGGLGGTYYNSGMYYSNGTAWQFMNVPYQATQVEVDAGSNDNKFVTPKTFTDASKWGTKQDSLTDVNFGSFSNGLTGKTTPVDADSIDIVDSADSNKAKKVTLTNFWLNYIKPLAVAFFGNPVKIIYKSTTPTSALTGTTAETQMATFSVPANTLSTTDFLHLVNLFCKKTTNTSSTTFRIRVNSTNNFATATLIASTVISGTGNFLNAQKNWRIHSGNLLGLANSSTGVSDITQGTANYSSTAFDVTNTIYFFISGQHVTGTDSVTIEGFKFTN